MSAQEVLAQHQINQWAQHDGWWGCTCDGDVKCDAAHQLDALKAAGYEVVELPGAVNPDAWFSQAGNVVLRHDVDLISSFTPRRAREIAAALLAAAVDAEAAGVVR